MTLKRVNFLPSKRSNSIDCGSRARDLQTQHPR
jgi:hypothetical protein